MPVEVLNFHLKPWDFFTQVGTQPPEWMEARGGTMACTCCAHPFNCAPTTYLLCPSSSPSPESHVGPAAHP